MQKGHLKIEGLQYRAGIITKEEFFENLWHSRGKKISFYIRRLVITDRETGADLFQEIMLKIYHNLESCNPLVSIDAWIYRIARNHCIDFLKKKKEETAAPMREEQLPGEENPEQEYITKEVMGEVEAAINKLTPEERELAFLRLYENMKYQAISEITGENINTLKTRMQKIKEKLSHELKDHHHEK